MIKISSDTQLDAKSRRTRGLPIKSIKNKKCAARDGFTKKKVEMDQQFTHATISKIINFVSNVYDTKSHVHRYSPHFQYLTSIK